MTTMQSLILSVTSLVSFVGVLTPLIWAAIQDGRYEAAQAASRAAQRSASSRGERATRTPALSRATTLAA